MSSNDPHHRGKCVVLMASVGYKRPRDPALVEGNRSSIRGPNRVSTVAAVTPSMPRRPSSKTDARSELLTGASIPTEQDNQSEQEQNLEHGCTAGQHIPNHTYKKSVKPTRFMMPRSSNVENPQPQVNEEQSAKSVDEEIESDDSNFVSSHQVSHVHKGNPPPSSLRNSKFEIGGPSSRTRAKVTGCTTTNIPAKTMKDKIEGAGKGKVRVDVLIMVLN